MHSSLTTDGLESRSYHRLTSLLKLPGLCCQAAGGDAAWADELILAWLLFYTAADIMDSVQDCDESDTLLFNQKPGAALNVASGLYFSGSLALNRLYEREETREAASFIANNFYNTFMVMTSGQYSEFEHEQLTLDQYWKIARAKSGAFFALICRAGACLGSSDQSVLHTFGEMGESIGLYIQIRDDLGDISRMDSLKHKIHRTMLMRSLPVVYTMEFLPELEKARILEQLDRLDHDPQTLAAFIELINQSGAALYIQAEMDKHRSMAIAALDRAVTDVKLRAKIALILVKVFDY